MAVYNPSPELQAFALRLKAARKVHGESQTDLAGYLGVSLPRYHAWERGNATPNNFRIYQKLCGHLGVTVAWLFFGDDRVLSAELKAKLRGFLTLATRDDSNGF